MSSPRPRILIIDDSDLARDALSAALREQYVVAEAPSVAAALAALSVAPHGFAAVVLDLRLDAPCAPLHARLDTLRVPVLVVSGLDEAAVRDAAESHGWASIAKPCDPDALVAAVEAILERPAVVERAPAPVDVEAVRSASSPPYSDPGVARVDLLSRRALRGVCALAIAALTVYGDATGHPVSGVTVAVLGALGMGATAVADAARKRPGVTAVGGAGLVLLALGGQLGGVQGMGSAAAIGVAGVTALVDRARGA